jgi:hypothetical protein
MEDTVNRAGLVDAANRVSRELLRTPRFKAGLKMMLNSLDPDSAPDLVKTLMWEDTDVFLSLLGSLPAMVNIVFLSLRELTVQLDNFTPEMLADFMAQLIEKMDGEALGEALGSTALLFARMGELPASKVAERGAELGAGVARGFARARYPGEEMEGTSLAAAMLPAIGKMVKGVAAAASLEGSPARQAVRTYAEDLAGVVRDHPALAREVAGPLLEAWQAASGEKGGG